MPQPAKLYKNKETLFILFFSVLFLEDMEINMRHLVISIYGSRILHWHTTRKRWIDTLYSKNSFKGSVELISLDTDLFDYLLCI